MLFSTLWWSGIWIKVEILFFSLFFLFFFSIIFSLIRSSHVQSSTPSIFATTMEDWSALLSERLTERDSVEKTFYNVIESSMSYDGYF